MGMFKRLKLTYKTNSVISADKVIITHEIVGTPLATFRRRALAIVIDFSLLYLIGIPLGLLVIFIYLKFESPKLANEITSFIKADSTDTLSTKGSTREMVLLFNKTYPEQIPLDWKWPIEHNDFDSLDSVVDSWNFVVDLTADRALDFNYSTKQLKIGPDAFIGQFGNFMGKLTFFLAYFSLFPWLTRGKTPGKWITGIRIVRLDGEPVTLWDAFGRAGGYSASFSTLMLGFFEAYWSMNRQALHDKIAGTTVIRELKSKSEKVDA